MSFSTIATAAQVDINEVNTDLTCYFMLVVCFMHVYVYVHVCGAYTCMLVWVYVMYVCMVYCSLEKFWC